MYEKYLKRILDVIFCVFAVIVLSPIYLLTAIGIKLSSKGSVLYYSVRAGKDGKPFNFYKFRSMHTTTHRKDYFIADPDRVFPFGKLIRRWKIDELPQLVNIIRGDMSIVGPRPMETSSVGRIYCGEYARILSIRPGLTSAASLFDYTVGDSYVDDEAYRRDVLPNKLKMELYYLDHQSFRYDVALVLRTIAIILGVMCGKKSFGKQPEYIKISGKQDV